MPPTPLPTADEITAVREIAGETSYSLIEGKVSALSDAEWARALEKIDAYEQVNPKRHIAVDSKVKVSFEQRAKRIQEEMRVLLGLPALTDDERFASAFPGYISVETETVW